MPNVGFGYKDVACFGVHRSAGVSAAAFRSLFAGFSQRSLAFLNVFVRSSARRL